MHQDISAIKNSLRQFSGACHRLADNPAELSRDPNLKLDLQAVYKGDLQDAVAAMQRLITVMNNGVTQ